MLSLGNRALHWIPQVAHRETAGAMRDLKIQISNSRFLMGSAFIVRMYAMDRWFLGTLSGNEIILIPVKANTDYKGDDPARAISIGKKENARDAFAKLSEEVNNFDFRAYSARRHSRKD